MARECPECRLVLPDTIAAGDRCPECEAIIPAAGPLPRPSGAAGPRSPRRPPRGDDTEGPPRHGDGDRAHRPRPRREEGGRSRPRKQPSTAVTIVLVLVGVVALMGLFCCAWIGKIMMSGPNEVTVLDASRQPHPQGGTSTVTVNLRVGATRPGNMVHGHYIFNAKVNSRTTTHHVDLTGTGGAEYRTTIATLELIKEPGPVEFWVEREERGNISRVSRSFTIP